MTSYDPKKVSIIVDGMFITGVMDGTFVTAAKNNDTFIPHVGAQGDTSYSKSADETGTISITLKADSSSLPFLRSLAKQDRDISAKIIDMNTNNFQAGGTKGRILKVPGREFGQEITGVTVSIHVADYDEK